MPDTRGKMEDEYSYYARWGQVVGTEHAPDIGYDPRQRPWYRAAIAANSVAISNAYVFSGTNRPGVTLSRQIKTSDGALLGVFGADLSTDTLSRLLDQIRIGSHGIVFILDRDGRLIGYPDPNRTIVRQGDRVDVVFADAVADPLVAGAVRRYAGGSGQFRSALDNTGEEYLVSFTPVQGMLGDSWTVGVIADPDEFVAPMRRASLVILAAGSSFLLLACIGIILASRLLTRPIAGLTHETTRIRRLELEGPVQVKSNIAEIASLTDAISATKAACAASAVTFPESWFAK
jgi:adenylate cyclase